MLRSRPFSGISGPMKTFANFLIRHPEISSRNDNVPPVSASESLAPPWTAPTLQAICITLRRQHRGEHAGPLSPIN